MGDVAFDRLIVVEKKQTHKARPGIDADKASLVLQVDSDVSPLVSSRSAICGACRLLAMGGRRTSERLTPQEEQEQESQEPEQLQVAQVLQNTRCQQSWNYIHHSRVHRSDGESERTGAWERTREPS